MTQAHEPRAARRPWITAAPSPLRPRSGVWRRSTISRSQNGARSSMKSAVPSVLASTKMISIATVGSTVSSRSINAATLPSSFFVGTTIERSGRAGVEAT